MKEQGVIFDSEGKQLAGICHHANQDSDKGVVIVVGGPQTRVGSHRFFVQLARALAEKGINVFRFDYQGAGDSEGDVVGFEAITKDINHAINAFIGIKPEVNRITLWGLCDAASAILLHQYKQPHPNISQLILLNPWVRQEHTQAKTFLKYYYFKRLLSRDFWYKVFSGKLNFLQSTNDIKAFNEQRKCLHSNESFVEQMYKGLVSFEKSVTIILSGNDLTADEFKCLCQDDNSWKKATKRKNTDIYLVDQANHTFSNLDCKKHVISITFSSINGILNS